MNKLTSAVKVLVVDDQPLIVEELCEFLESSGYRCVPCESSEQAVQRFKEDLQIGLVLCDLHMPDMDGIQVLREIKMRFPRTQVLMLTGHADMEVAISGMAMGAFDYLMKPVELEILVGKIREACSRRKIAGEEKGMA